MPDVCSRNRVRIASHKSVIITGIAILIILNEEISRNSTGSSTSIFMRYRGWQLTSFFEFVGKASQILFTIEFCHAQKISVYLHFNMNFSYNSHDKYRKIIS